MKTELIKIKGDWQDVVNRCRATVGKADLGKEPSAAFKRKILIAEHSPIREIHISWVWRGIKSWVATHFCRHHIGVEKYVQTQRTDRTGINRDELPQGALVTLEMDLNAQAIINISRKRLCNCASKETREAWQQVKESIKEIDPVLADKMVPECLYRGFCPEFMSPCGYSKTQKYQEDLIKYRNTDYNESKSN
jgi:hypothetical protein